MTLQRLSKAQRHAALTVGDAIISVISQPP
jgi:hypothetical protein